MASNSVETTSAQEDSIEEPAEDVDQENHTEEPTTQVIDSSNIDVFLRPYCPPRIRCLLDTAQLIVHQENLRLNEKVNVSLKHYEVEDTTGRVLFIAEQELRRIGRGICSLKFIVYDRDKKEVMRVICPTAKLCFCCGATWHWCNRCYLRAVVYCPPDFVAGFVKRKKSVFVQDFEIQDPSENTMLRLRGALNDLELYSADCVEELGRLSVRGWVGVMHELRRARSDWGVTFPIDLEVKMKATLLGAVFVMDYLCDKARE